MPHSKEFLNARRAQRIADGLCPLCGKPSEGVFKYCDHCRAYAAKHKAKKRAKGACTRCKDGIPQPGWLTCEACLSKARERTQRLRHEVFEAYGGPKCVCCGETHEIFLQLDHINNDGSDHRRAISPRGVGNVGAMVYAWVKRNGFPPGFQILCANCNFAKALIGYCPHQPKPNVVLGMTRTGRRKQTYVERKQERELLARSLSSAPVGRPGTVPDAGATPETS